ncbi:MAG: CPBP family intramembrane metalloprotease [Cytophagia bacterium]|nr:CPBP family intramembrane metalloprotease [Cytophagia bacterium]
MVGILLQLTLSWVLLRFIEKKNLLALGILPIDRRVWQMIIGVLGAMLICIVHSLIQGAIQGIIWQVNPVYTLNGFVSALGFCVRSVLFEELIFRGALLYILLQRMRSGIALMISSLAFGIYHWFTWGVLGDVKMMIIALVMTGAYGWTLAYAFYKTKSMMLGFGLHLGWLLVSMIIFSSSTIGSQWLIPVNKAIPPSDTTQTVYFFAQLVGIPLFNYMLVRMVIKWWK